jgi:hypothetical protein
MALDPEGGRAGGRPAQSWTGSPISMICDGVML